MLRRPSRASQGCGRAGFSLSGCWGIVLTEEGIGSEGEGRLRRMGFGAATRLFETFGTFLPGCGGRSAPGRCMVRSATGRIVVANPAEELDPSPLTLLRPLRDGGCRPPRRRFRPGTRRRRKRGELRGGVTCAEQRAGEIRIHIRLLLCPCESEAREKGGWTPAIGGRGISLSAAGPSSHPCIPYNIQICLLKWLTEVTESGSAVGVGTAVQKAHVRVRNPAVLQLPIPKSGRTFCRDRFITR